MTFSAEDNAPTQRLTIALEEASIAARMLGLLGSGTQQWQFVGRVDDHRKYTSPAFAAPYSWGGVPIGSTLLPQEEWAPGMAQALADVKQEIERGGWVEVGCGAQPWLLTYEPS